MEVGGGRPKVEAEVKEVEVEEEVVKEEVEEAEEVKEVEVEEVEVVEVEKLRLGVGSDGPRASTCTLGSSDKRPRPR